MGLRNPCPSHPLIHGWVDLSHLAYIWAEKFDCPSSGWAEYWTKCPPEVLTYVSLAHSPLTNWVSEREIDPTHLLYEWLEAHARRGSFYPPISSNCSFCSKSLRKRGWMISGWANNSIHESPHYYKSHIHLISSPPQHFSNCSFCSIIRGGGNILNG